LYSGNCRNVFAATPPAEFSCAFLQSYDFTIIHTAGKNQILINKLSRIYEKRTADTEAEIMEDPTINMSFPALTFPLISSSPDKYSPISYPHFTSGNTTSSSTGLPSDPNYRYDEYQPDTIATMSGIPDSQAPSSVCDDEECDCELHGSRHILIFGEEAYKTLTPLEDTRL
jgi:hypothetical protein